MKALVIGGNGFLGSHLVDRLAADHWEVVVVDVQDRRYDPLPAQVHFVRGQLRNDCSFTDALAGVDVVFHLAWSTVHETANQDPVADVRANLIPTIDLLEACRRENGMRRIVFASSGGTVYGATHNLPIHETHSQNPLTAYGVTKLAVEKYLHMYHHLYGIDYAILRPSVLFGPRQNPLSRQGAIAVFLHQIALGRSLTIWGDGTTTRDFVYVSDMVDALMAAADRDLSQQRVFNIGGGQEISLNQVIAMAEETVGRRAVVNYGAERRFDMKRIFLDISQAQQELNWSPKVSVEEGLVKTWAWMSATLCKEQTA